MRRWPKACIVGEIEDVKGAFNRTPKAKKTVKRKSTVPAKTPALEQRFVRLSKAPPGCEKKRNWRCPKELLSTPAEGFLALSLGRAWALFGEPIRVDDGRFQYVLRDTQTAGVIITYGLDPFYDLVFGGKGPATKLAASIDALEQEINSAQPVDCSITLEGDKRDTRFGYRKGKPFSETVRKT